MENRKKIMITGAAGALAKKVIEQLKKDYKIIAVDFRSKVDLGIPVESYKIDFNKRIFEDIFREHQFEGIIHLGRIGASESNRHARYNANVIGTRKLFDLAKKYGVIKIVPPKSWVARQSDYNKSLDTFLLQGPIEQNVYGKGGNHFFHFSNSPFLLRNI